MNPVRAHSSWRLAAVLALAAAGGCDNMEHQPSARPYDPSGNFADGTSARTPPAHTVPAGPLPAPAFTTGSDGATWLARAPVRATLPTLQRGRERFNIDCAVCHGEDGYGRGIVVRRGFPQPPSLHSALIRGLADGQIYDVITRGYGAMYPAADRLSPANRWAIVLYIRALQLSQNATIADIPPQEAVRLQRP